MMEWATGAPGNASCSRTVALTSSAAPTAKAPARVAGAVVPSVGMVTKVTGTPASANTRAASMPPSSCTSGEIVPIRSESTGRRRSSLGAAGDDRRHLDRVARLALAVDHALQDA